MIKPEILIMEENYPSIQTMLHSATKLVQARTKITHELSEDINATELQQKTAVDKLLDAKKHHEFCFESYAHYSEIYRNYHSSDDELIYKNTRESPCNF